jgi:hypothetical protein
MSPTSTKTSPVRHLTMITALVVAMPALGGCAGHKGASAEPATPTWDAGGQAKCKVATSKAEPLVVEWPSADRAKLEALTRRGIVPVKYNGCEMQVMGACAAKGEYRYVGTTLKRDSVRIKDADELYAKLPFGAAGLESTLQQSGQLDVTMSLVGRYAADQPVIHEQELTGACAGATHVISALIVGAFEFSAKGTRSTKDRTSVFDAAAGSNAEAEKQVITRDGDEASCAKAESSDAVPPPGCRALIRVEVLSLPEAEARAKENALRAQREYDSKKAAAANRRTLAYAIGGAGVASGLLGGFLALQSNGQISEIEEGGLARSADIEDAEGSARTLMTGAWIAGGVAIGAIGAGAALLFTTTEPKDTGLTVHSARPAVSPRFVANSSGAGVRW